MLCVSMLIFYHIIHLPLNIAFWPVIFAFLYQDIPNTIDIVDIFCPRDFKILFTACEFN